MTTLELNMAATGTLLLLSVFSGTALRLFGRPLHKLIFAVHKLLAVGFTVMAVILVRLYLIEDANATLIFLAIAAALILLILLVSGGLLSFDKRATEGLKASHRLASLTIVLLLIVLSYLVFKAMQ